MKKIIKLAMILTIGIIGNTSCSIKEAAEQVSKKSPLLESLENLDRKMTEIENDIEKTNKIPHSRVYLFSFDGAIGPSIFFIYKETKTDNNKLYNLYLWRLKEVVTNYKKKKSLTNQERKLLAQTQNWLRNMLDNLPESDELSHLISDDVRKSYKAIVEKFLSLPEYKEVTAYDYTIRSINRWIKSWFK